MITNNRPKRVVMVTECSMADNVQAEMPDLEIVRPCNLCPHMKRITLDTDRTYFDTNVSDHHHLFFEEKGVLHDIPGDSVRVEGLPPIPAGSKVRSVEVIVRMTGEKKGR